MGKIALLSPQLINKISAGEVVERPVSVLKELCENALDAGATSLSIQLSKGGTESIIVTDNGVGMDKEDVEKSIIQHATSKISDVDQLFNLESFGFRGEALAAISAVSRFSIRSKHDSSQHAWKLSMFEKQTPELIPDALPLGTQVEVNDLFYAVPARRKFLKSENTEYRHCLLYLENLALSRPEIEISFQHNDKTIVHYKSISWQDRAKELLAEKGIFEPIIFNREDDNLHCFGLISKPSQVSATRKNQFIFVNQRPIFDPALARTILDAYETLIPRGYYPGFILFLQINPHLVDVNVHPQKKEVRFSDQKTVRKQVYRAVRDALDTVNLAPKYIQEPTAFDTSQPSSHSSRFSPAEITKPPKLSSSRNSLMSIPSIAKRNTTLVTAQVNSSNRALETVSIFPGKPENDVWRVLCQVHKSYIILETPEGIKVLDQHAVSEIVEYHRITKRESQVGLKSQHLLLPEAIVLSDEEMVLWQEHKQHFQDLAWGIDQLSENSLQVSVIPVFLEKQDISLLVREMLAILSEGKKLDYNQRHLELIKYEACRGAVMFGDVLSFSEMQSLVDTWRTIPNNDACEHGRPSNFDLPLSQIKKLFNR